MMFRPAPPRPAGTGLRVSGNRQAAGDPVRTFPRAQAGDAPGGSVAHAEDAYIPA